MPEAPSARRHLAPGRGRGRLNPTTRSTTTQRRTHARSQVEPSRGSPVGAPKIACTSRSSPIVFQIDARGWWFLTAERVPTMPCGRNSPGSRELRTLPVARERAQLRSSRQGSRGGSRAPKRARFVEAARVAAKDQINLSELAVPTRNRRRNGRTTAPAKLTLAQMAQKSSPAPVGFFSRGAVGRSAGVTLLAGAAITDPKAAAIDRPVENPALRSRWTWPNDSTN
jgi:hypothetical protein